VAAHATESVGPPASTRPRAPIDLLDRVLFYVLLALTCARPLISESYERLELSFLSALPDAGGPTPVTTAWLDTLTLAAAALTLARGDRWRASWPAAGGMVLLLAGVCVSGLRADDPLLARLAGSSLWIGVLGGLALAALMRARWMWYVLIAAWLATTGTTAVKCVRQTLVEFPELRRTWEGEYRPQLLRQGYAADDPMLVNYERRMRSQEAYGYLAHANVTGSGLMLGLVTLAGILLGRMLTRAEKWLTLVGALGLPLFAVALGFTGSKGAWGAAVLGVGGLVALGWGARWIAGHARLALVLLLVCYLTAIGGTALYGSLRGTLPHPSLAFRWYYWTAAARAWQDAPLTGLGRGGFATAYMRYKRPESTEEVRDPHNLLVSLLVELGPLGLAGGLVIAGTVVLAGLRQCGAHADGQNSASEPASPGTARVTAPGSAECLPLLLRQAAPAMVGVCLVHAFFSSTPLQHPAVVVLWIADVAVIWAVAFLLVLVLLASLGHKPRGTLWLVAGLSAGFLAALIHNLLDFAAMTAGGLALLATLGAAVGGVRHTPGDAATACARRRGGEAVPVLLAVLLVAAHVGLVSLPVGTRETRADELQRMQRTAEQSGDWRGVAARVTAALAEIPDGAEFRALLRAATNLSLHRGLPDDARLTWLEDTERRAQNRLAARPSTDTGEYLVLGRLQQELARGYLQHGDALRATVAAKRSAAAYDRAAELYPTNPRTQIAAGDAWYDLWKQSGAAHDARQARAYYLAALRIDDVRPPEEVQRLRPGERGPVEARLRELP
jgi:O-antigen ligase